MSLLARFVDFVNVKYHRSAFREVMYPFQMNGASDECNVLIYLNKGHLELGKNEFAVKPDSFYFFPQGQKISVRHGKGSGYTDLGKENFYSDDLSKKYVRNISGLSDFSSKKEVYTIVGFDVLLYNAIPFFSIIDIPPFPLVPDEEFAHLIKHIALEEEQNKLGRDIIIANYMHEIVIHMFRFIESQPHLKKCIEKLDYLTDKRLVDIVRFIQNNLDRDLSNKTIADVAFVSEDYVGQFFKSLTQRNLQEYIENQRLEKAMQLLKSQPDNIQEIAHMVGFKDAAYFSRRFKMKFGANAIAIRSNNKNHVT